MLDVLKDTVIDFLKLLPFLFITYLVLEFIEHKAENGMTTLMRRSGTWGPIIGSALGIVPQCGFSASAANLYAQRVITCGTLVAVFLSTSDEMLPVLISESVATPTIIKILLVKFLAGIVIGLLIDKVIRPFRGNSNEVNIHETMCEPDGCDCEEGNIFTSALRHTAQIAVFILVITFAMNTLIFFIGEEALAGIILNRPVIGPLIAGLVGMIPNCAASVVITELYIEGAMSTGAMLAGLLASSGIGVLVLCRVNHHKAKENFTIALMLYGESVIIGIIAELCGIAF